MLKKLGRGFLVLILTAAVLLGAYLCFVRFLHETSGRTVEIVVDLNDLKKMAAYEKRPLAGVLDEVRKAGISQVGVFEETLPDAAALGELYYGKGAGILRLPLIPVSGIKPDRTYIYIPDETVRRRIASQLKWALGERSVRFLTKMIVEVDEAEEELRELGLGISESQRQFLAARGFGLVPRVAHDPRYHLGNIEAKVSSLKDFGLVIFDGEKILGYPSAIPALADALKKFQIKYGYVEIVKQDGDKQLSKLMGRDVIRVHSVPKDELEKIDKDEALDRFVRAARERGVRLIYLRPFLPPRIDAYPVAYNLEYFQSLKNRLEAAGFVLGQAEKTPDLKVKGWQLLLLSSGVLIGALFLLDAFFTLPIWLIYFLFLAGLSAVNYAGSAGLVLLVQRSMALTAALVFPAYAVIATFSKLPKKTSNLFYEAAVSIINILAETSIGIFLMVGLLADSRFMSGIEGFPAVKTALIAPVMIVGLYFILKAGEGSLRERVRKFLETRVTVLTALAGVFLLAALAVLVARSGNFTLPVPGFEKSFRNWLEILLYVRPRTKEFLVGYPFLCLAAMYYLKGKKQWLWLLAAIGVVAPVSVFNSFSHIHTPLVISITRTFNGLVLGLLVGWLVGWIAGRYITKE
jgi:hypothetical protein